MKWPTPSTPPLNPSDKKEPKMRIRTSDVDFDLLAADDKIDKCLAFVEKADFDYHEAMFNLLVAAKTINDIAAALVNAEMNKVSQS